MPSFDPKIPVDRIRIKTIFVSAVLSETAARIREDQNAVVDAWDLFESGRVKSWLQGHFSVGNNEGGAKLSMRYLTYFRFLDMPDPRRSLRRVKKEGYHNYNQIVFGNLYSYGLPEIQFGLTEQVYQQVTGAINTAMTRKSRYTMANDMLNAISKEDRFAAAILSKSMRQGYY
jgi:hypothetical protein